MKTYKNKHVILIQLVPWDAKKIKPLRAVVRAFRFIQKGRAGASLSLCISCNLVANDRPGISRHIPGYPVTFPSVIPCPFSHACPSVAWVQSYADERCQGLGVIYQACSFLYLGFHESPLSELDGEVYYKLLLTATSRAASVEHTCGPTWNGTDNAAQAATVPLRPFSENGLDQAPVHADSAIPQTTTGLTKKDGISPALLFCCQYARKLLPIAPQTYFIF